MAGAQPVMKKVAIVFVLAVILPSLVLAWLAVRSLSDQQFLLERQQSLLYQGVTDSMAKTVLDAVSENQRQFSAKVMELLRDHKPQEITKNFDAQLRQQWPMAQVGFVVTLNGDFLCPSPFDSAETRLFCANNSRFLANRESVEVYWNPKGNVGNNLANNTAPNSSSLSQKGGGSSRGDATERLGESGGLRQEILQCEKPQRDSAAEPGAKGRTVRGIAATAILKSGRIGSGISAIDRRGERRDARAVRG